jgi:hypothetical protein
MFQGQSFQPIAGPGFLPQVRLAGYRPPAVRPQMRGPYMGLSLADGQKMYEDAKKAIATFDQLAYDVTRISFKPVRDQIISEFGLLEPNNNDKALNQRNDLQEYVAEVEKSTPPNYYVFIQDTTRPRHRLERVQAADVELQRAFDDAKRTYDLLPEPQVIIKEIQVPGAAAPGGTDYTVPLLVGAGAVTLALIFA